VENKKFAEGLTILMKYVDSDGHDLAAEHDVVYFGPALVSDVGKEDNERLHALGWFIKDGSWAAFA
jgi:hypothetical protein